MLKSWHSLTLLAIASLTFCASCDQETAINYEDPEPASVSTDSGADAQTPTRLPDAKVDEPCRSWCTTQASKCAEPMPTSYPDREATVSLWSARCSDAGNSSLPFVVEARCADDTMVLHTGNGRSTERRYFDVSGKFQGLLTEVDFIDPVCQAKRYWPTEVPCEQAEVTRVFCGSVYTVGQKLDG